MSSGTVGTGSYAKVTQEGVLNVYNSAGTSIYQVGSGTIGSSGTTTLYMESGGNLSIYNSGTLYWASSTQNGCSYMTSGQTLTAGNSLYATGTSDDTFQLTMQTDGNLVLYHYASGSTSGSAFYSTSTDGLGGSFAKMDTNGQLSVYKSDGTTAVWKSDSDTVTSGSPYLRIDVNGNMIIANGATVLWQSGSSTTYGSDSQQICISVADQASDNGTSGIVRAWYFDANHYKYQCLIYAPQRNTKRCCMAYKMGYDSDQFTNAWFTLRNSSDGVNIGEIWAGGYHIDHFKPYDISDTNLGKALNGYVSSSLDYKRFWVDNGDHGSCTIRIWLEDRYAFCK